ncbi:MAG: hypothetical protein RLZZ127_835 [Planctomycetota bacterium]|jgi:serine/threonine-protein kinase
MFRPGDRLDHYVIERHLGTGGFGEVWLARESITERPIALKFINPSMASEDNIVRLERETALLARLDHPAIVTYAGRGYHRHLPYLATAFIQGPTLATLILRGGRMDEVQVLRIAVQVAEGLGYAWDTAELIHRDLKPENILVDVAASSDEDGVRVRIIDLGLALGRRLADAGDRETEAEDRELRRAERRIAAGTPQTMSPEQIQGGELTVRSDMYALGVVMYHLLTGQPPFFGDQDSVIRAHLQLQPRPLGEVLPGLQPQTAQIVHRLLSKLPEGRYRDWGACAASLRTVLHRLAPPRPATARISQRQRTVRPASTPTGISTPTGDLPPAAPATGFSAPLPPALAPDLAAAAARAPQPAVEDGLTPEQRAAVWSWLFRQPALVAAAVAPVQPAAAERAALPVPAALPMPAAPPAPGVPTAPDPAPRPISDLLPFLSTGPAAAVTAPLQPPTHPQPPAPPPASEPEPAAAAAADPGIAAEASAMILEAARELVVGRQAPAGNAPEPLTKRVTARLRRLVAGREASLHAIDEALAQGRTAQAARLLDELASDTGNDGACALRRARLAALDRDPVMLVRWARSAVNQGVEGPMPLALLGLGHLIQGEPVTAITIFTRLAAEHPQSAIGFAGLAAADLLAGRPAKADGALALARERDRSPALRRLEACFARLSGQPGAEEAVLTQLLRDHPDDGAAAARLRAMRSQEGSSRSRRSTATANTGSGRLPPVGEHPALVRRRPTDPGR